jgi:hypothetical protein
MNTLDLEIATTRMKNNKSLEYDKTSTDMIKVVGKTETQCLIQVWKKIWIEN